MHTELYHTWYSSVCIKIVAAKPKRERMHLNVAVCGRLNQVDKKLYCRSMTRDVLGQNWATQGCCERSKKFSASIKRGNLLVR